jgi:hypothetical protein
MAKKINLEAFAGGALSEMVNRELVKINQNIHDPNADAEKARTMTVTMKFKPDEDRRLVKVELSAKSSLVPCDAVKTTMVSGKDLKTGAVEMSEYGNEGQITGQMEFDDQGRAFDPDTGEIPDAPSKIRDLRRAL